MYTLGTKIFFKSKKITVITQKNNSKRLIAQMKEPWYFLNNNEIPTYTIKSEESIVGKDGTKIIIEGYLVDNPEKYYNLETIRDYILWFTAGGSFKNIFATYPELNCYVKNMQIAPRIFINDCILDVREEIAGAHQFFQPQENPNADNNVIDSIAHYSLQSTTDLICLNSEGETLLVEVEFLLSNLFRHEHPYATFDCIV